MSVSRRLATIGVVILLSGCAGPTPLQESSETSTPGVVGLWYELPTPAAPGGSFSIYEWQVPLDYYDNGGQFTLHVDPGDAAVTSWGVLAFLVGPANHTFVGGVVAPAVTTSRGEEGPAMAPVYVPLGVDGWSSAHTMVSLPDYVMHQPEPAHAPVDAGHRLLLVTAASSDTPTTWTPTIRSLEEPSARFVRAGHAEAMAAIPRPASPVAVGHGFGAEFAGTYTLVAAQSTTYESGGAKLERLGPLRTPQEVITITSEARGWATAAVTSDLYEGAALLDIKATVLGRTLQADATAGLDHSTFCALNPVCIPIHTTWAMMENVGEGGADIVVERHGSEGLLGSEFGVSHVWLNVTEDLGLGAFGRLRASVNGEVVEAGS